MTKEEKINILLYAIGFLFNLDKEEISFEKIDELLKINIGKDYDKLGGK